MARAPRRCHNFQRSLQLGKPICVHQGGHPRGRDWCRGCRSSGFLEWGWFHPNPPRREPVSRILSAQRERRTMVRAEGVEPSRALRPYGFSYALRLSPPSLKSAWGGREVRGLDYTFAIHRSRVRGSGAARLVSTPSRREVPSGLGSGLPFQGSPNLSSSASPVSRRALKLSLSPLRLPFRHARSSQS
jgi:hypothetical protein